MVKDIIIRTIRPDEIGIPVEWARQEGWNPGINDAACHYAVDPAGWFCAERDGEIIGVVVGTNYDESFSFGGFYIIHPSIRDQGIGWPLCQRMLAHVGDRNFGVDGVFEMQNKYDSRMGMTFAYRNIRWQGINQSHRSGDLIQASEVPFSSLLAYDTAHFPAERRSFLQQWIRQEGGSALVKMTSDEKVAGYGVIRPCFEGYKIGPIFADTPLIADEIFDDLTAFFPGETIFFDTPEPNAHAVQMAKRRGMTEVFGTARMYSKSIPQLPLHEIFGVTTFELG